MPEVNLTELLSADALKMLEHIAEGPCSMHTSALSASLGWERDRGAKALDELLYYGLINGRVNPAGQT